MPFKKLSLFFLFIGCSILTIGQSQPAKVDSLNLEYSYFNSPEDTIQLDTSLFLFQQFDPLFIPSGFSAHNGSLGAISKPLYLNDDLNIGFLHHRNLYGSFLHKPSNSKMFHMKKPYSDIFYANSPKDFQYLKIALGQQLGPYVSMSAFYDLLNSTGIYAQQSNSLNNISLNIGFKSKDNRLISKLFLGRAKFSNDENGGLADPVSNFEQDSSLENRSFDLTSLNASASSFTGNKFIRKDIHIETSFLLNRPIKEDSMALIDSNQVLLKLTHIGSYNNTALWYEDPNPTYGFYKKIYLDSTFTNDSIYWNRFDNAFLLTIDAKELLRSELQIGIKHSHVSLHNPVFDHNINQLKFFTVFSKQVLAFDLKAFASTIIGDYNQGDFNLWASLSGKMKFLKSVTDHSIKMQYIAQRAPWVYNQFIGNHFVWGVNLEKESRFQLKYLLATKESHLTASIFYANIGGHVFLDSDLIPKQSASSFNYYQFAANKDFIGKRWKSNVNVLWQYNDGSTLRLPPIVANASIQYSLPLFKKALYIYPGVEATFLSAYYADAYMPALRMFYNQDTKLVESYPYIDVFLNMKIKEVRLFFKYAHINSGLMGFQYYLIPNYPMKDRNIQFGLSWRFIN